MPLPVRTLSPQASGFNPRTLSGLQIWADASASSSVTLNSGNVSELADLSGNKRHLQEATAANQPAYLTNGRNGRNVVDFGTANGKRLVQSLASAVTIAQPHTAFFAFKTPASGGYTLFDVVNATVDGTGRIIGYGNAATELRLEAGVGAPATVVADAWYVVVCVFNGTSSVRRMNTTTGTTYSAGTRSFSDRLVVGANYGLAGGLRSLLGEIGFYNKALSDAEATTVIRYLARKWAVTLT